MDIREAFNEVCKQAIVPTGDKWYVSLYCSEQRYGGPEEGGWWYTNTCLMASQEFDTEEQAVLARSAIDRLMAKPMRAEAQRAHGEQCQRELDYCEARGIDDSNAVFGEVDGAGDYYVVCEQTPGSQQNNERPHYE